MPNTPRFSHGQTTPGPVAIGIIFALIAVFGLSASSALAAEAPEAWAGNNTPESSSTVLLRGAVNPKGSLLTDCHFAYGPTTAYGQTAPCEGTIGSGGEPVSVTSRLTGLAPGTVGHFKVVTSSGAGSAESLDAPFATFEAPQPEGACPNETRREEQHTSFLPECRAYEMVSPPNKNGGDVMTYATRTRAAVSGNAVEFSSFQGFGDSKSADVATDYIAVRNASAGSQGWSTHGIFPMLDANSVPVAVNFEGANYQGEFSEDLSKGIFRTYTQLTHDVDTADVHNLYLREDLLTPGAESNLLLSTCPLCAETGEPLSAPHGGYNLKVAASTPDLGQTLFEAGRNLTADGPPLAECSAAFEFSGCTTRLYESDHGALRLVGRIPPAGHIECDDAGAFACEGAPISIAGVGASAGTYTFGTLSSDGSKAFFTVPPSNNDSNGALYMRLAHTITAQLNASERTPCLAEPESCAGEARPAQFAAISADGSRVFFSTDQQLMDPPCSGEYYVYDTSKPASNPHNLTCIPGTPTRGALGTNSDGSYFYFLAGRAIVPGQPEISGGSYGLYVWHNGTTRFIGASDGGLTANALNRGPYLPTRITPDGRNLLFIASDGDGLTGYDHGNTCSSHSVSGDGPCDELYLYKAGTGSLTCVSCNPDGSTATADAADGAREKTGGVNTSTHLSHALSDDGNRIFFETDARLQSEDTNGMRDVYVYDSAEGRLRLISSGNGAQGSYFLDATPDGSDVFFTTGHRLVGWDSDNNSDLYDARRGGGVPEPQPAAAPCQADACRSFSAAPAAVPPASESFSGAASPKPDHRRARKHAHKRKKAHKHRHRASHGRGENR